MAMDPTGVLSATARLVVNKAVDYVQEANRYPQQCGDLQFLVNGIDPLSNLALYNSTANANPMPQTWASSHSGETNAAVAKLIREQLKPRQAAARELLESTKNWEANTQNFSKRLNLRTKHKWASLANDHTEEIRRIGTDQVPYATLACSLRTQRLIQGFKIDLRTIKEELRMLNLRGFHDQLFDSHDGRRNGALDFDDEPEIDPGSEIEGWCVVQFESSVLSIEAQLLDAVVKMKPYALADAIKGSILQIKRLHRESLRAFVREGINPQPSDDPSASFHEATQDSAAQAQTYHDIRVDPAPNCVPSAAIDSAPSLEIVDELPSVASHELATAVLSALDSNVLANGLPSVGADSDRGLKLADGIPAAQDMVVIKNIASTSLEGLARLLLRRKVANLIESLTEQSVIGLTEYDREMVLKPQTTLDVDVVEFAVDTIPEAEETEEVDAEISHIEEAIALEGVKKTTSSKNAPPSAETKKLVGAEETTPSKNAPAIVGAKKLGGAKKTTPSENAPAAIEEARKLEGAKNATSSENAQEAAEEVKKLEGAKNITPSENAPATTEEAKKLEGAKNTTSSENAQEAAEEVKKLEGAKNITPSENAPATTEEAKKLEGAKETTSSENAQEAAEEVKKLEGARKTTSSENAQEAAEEVKKLEGAKKITPSENAPATTEEAKKLEGAKTITSSEKAPAAIEEATKLAGAKKTTPSKTAPPSEKAKKFETAKKTTPSQTAPPSEEAKKLEGAKNTKPSKNAPPSEEAEKLEGALETKPSKKRNGTLNTTPNPWDAKQVKSFFATQPIDEMARPWPFSIYLAITNAFASSNQVGEGGYGRVFKGSLPDGSFVAVKVAYARNSEIMNELRVTKDCHHPNVMSIFGYYLPGELSRLKAGQPPGLTEKISSGSVVAEASHNNVGGKLREGNPRRRDSFLKLWRRIKAPQSKRAKNVTSAPPLASQVDVKAAPTVFDNNNYEVEDENDPAIMKCGISAMIAMEYMENGDVRQFLQERGTRTWNWLVCTQILLGVAKGLEYLHSLGIMHRDIKPNNIFLSQNMDAKIGDFGISRFLSDNNDPYDDFEAHSHGSHVTTTVRGTSGYVDPHYIMTGQVTIKSDIYAFGILVMNLMTGNSKCYMQPVGGGRIVLLRNWFSNLANQEKYKKICDPALGESPYAKNIASLAMLCSNVDPDVRPSMDFAVKCLSMVVDRIKRRMAKTVQ